MPSSYEPAFRKALDRLNAGDLDEICERTGAVRRANGLSVGYFGREYDILLPEGGFDPEDIRQSDRILILHYLNSDAVPHGNGEFVVFKNLPGAMFYDYAYQKRGPLRILKRYGNRPEDLADLAPSLGGQKGDYGDVSIRFRVLPMIEAQVVMYKGDEEFPPKAEILFSDSIVAFLALEDVAVLAGKIAGKIADRAR